MLLSVRDLQTHFRIGDQTVRAVDHVDLSLDRGRILCLVGESGSGKSVTGMSLMRMIEPPGTIVGGSIMFDGIDILSCSESEMARLRGAQIATIPQDPNASLNPVVRVGAQLIEAIRIHDPAVSYSAARARARDALGAVGIPSPEARLDAYPFELSGGMRQRVVIAIAFLNRPKLVVADEPTTALDVTIQGQILMEVQRMAHDVGTALLWITHDLALASELADEIAVMYAGQIVESAAAEALLFSPKHPYTAGLLRSIPSMNEPGLPLPQIDGVQSAATLALEGCRFRARCRKQQALCTSDPPKHLEEQHMARCFFPGEATAPLAGELGINA